MCGIAGIMALEASPQDLEADVRRMIDRLAHRGPDDAGVYRDPTAPVALGHRRLAILDLSPRGHQPMRSRDGRFVVTYNGEIYNYRELRRALEGAGETFEGGSDTEVLVAAIARWGIEAALRRANGMFALAAWDRAERVLHLARDRLGKKPLYYGWVAGCFVFASELSAIRRLPYFDLAIDRDSLAAYLRYNATPGTRTIFERLRKLEPGGVRSLGLEAPAGTSPRLARFWSAAEAREIGRRAPVDGDPGRALDELEALLADAVAIRMEADVPLGAFLSGGVDSTLVVALMQAQSTRRIQTFTIGFEAPGYDEASHARAVAKHLGTDHTELTLSAEQAREVIPRLPEIFDEPFADSSGIPTYLVARMAREQVTVSLSGDGGDELFAGYDRYEFVARLHRAFEAIPPRVRRAASTALEGIGERGWELAARALGPVERTSVGRVVNRDRLRLLRALLRLEDPADFYRYLLSTWREDRPVVLGSSLPATSAPDYFEHGARHGRDDLIELASYLDLVGYLPDDVLVKVDRASMAVSLEARAPLLDYRIVECALRFPIDWKVRDGRPKWPLWQLVLRHLPRAIMERPKMGFGVPIREWLRGPLCAWADELLDPAALRAEGFFDVGLVSRRWSEHRTGRRNWAPEIWAILMFQAWKAHAPV